jgi:hypothetical protein
MIRDLDVEHLAILSSYVENFVGVFVVARHSFPLYPMRLMCSMARSERCHNLRIDVDAVLLDRSRQDLGACHYVPVANEKKVGTAAKRYE